MTSPRTFIRCTIAASSSKLRAELRSIAQICAIDAGLAVPLETQEAPQAETNDPFIRLDIPLEPALDSSSIWSLACRIASFCPQVRVCALIGKDCATHQGTAS